MQPVIRRYRPSDKDAVLTLFSSSIREATHPCFNNAMTSPLYLTITLTLCAAGYLLSSVLWAVLLPGAWVSLVYYCCHKRFASFVRLKLNTDMKDIPGNYLSRPDDCFWVAEAELDGRLQIVGMAAVVGKQGGNERYGELFRLSILPSCRRMGLGVKMMQTAIDFCKERGYSAIILVTDPCRYAAVALYKKMGFHMVFLQPNRAELPALIMMLSKATALTMKKHL